MTYKYTSLLSHKIWSDVGHADRPVWDYVSAGDFKPLLSWVYVSLPSFYDHWHSLSLVACPHVSNGCRCHLLLNYLRYVWLVQHQKTIHVSTHRPLKFIHWLYRYRCRFYSYNLPLPVHAWWYLRKKQKNMVKESNYK